MKEKYSRGNGCIRVNDYFVGYVCELDSCKMGKEHTDFSVERYTYDSASFKDKLCSIGTC